MLMQLTQVLVPSKGYVWQCRLCGETFHMRPEADKHADPMLKQCNGRYYW